MYEKSNERSGQTGLMSLILICIKYTIYDKHSYVKVCLDSYDTIYDTNSYVKVCHDSNEFHLLFHVIVLVYSTISAVSWLQILQCVLTKQL